MRPRHVRVAVAQIATLPTFLKLIRSPKAAVDIALRMDEEPFLFDADLENLRAAYEILAPLQRFRNFDSMHSMYLDFSNEYRTTLLKEISVIAERCEEAAVEILVLPEYSVPWQALAHIKKIAVRYSLNIVAGSHTLDVKDLEDYPYHDEVVARVGSSWRRIAICPVVLAEESNPQLIFKQIRSRFEPEIDEIKDDPRRSVIEMPLRDSGKRVAVAIAICSEFVREPDQDSSSETIRQVQNPWAEADLIAVVGWSPKSKPFISEAITYLQRRRHGGRVSIAFANTGLYGGSSILCRGDGLDVFRADQLEEALIIREAEFGRGAGSPRSAPSDIAEVSYFVIGSKPQRILWAACESLRNGRFEDARRKFAALAPSTPLPSVLRNIAESVRPFLDGDDLRIGEINLARYILLSEYESTLSSLLRVFIEFSRYFNALEGTAEWRLEYSKFIGLLHQRIPLVQQFGAIEVTLQGENRAMVGDTMPEESASRLEDFSPHEYNWAKLVNVTDDSNYFNFAIQITSVPNETTGVAFQSRFISQILDLLSPGGSVEVVQIRYSSPGEQRPGAFQIFLLFRFCEGDQWARAGHLAQEMFSISVDRLLFYGLKPIGLKSPFFRDFGGLNEISEEIEWKPEQEEAKGIQKRKEYRYCFSRRPVSDSEFLPFEGRGEASSIVKLVAPLNKPTQFTITLRQPLSEQPPDEELIWSEVRAGADPGALHGYLQTVVQDLQDLQDAVQAVSFQPQLFMPGTDNGCLPYFPTEIRLETSVAGLDLLPRAIGLELAGARRCAVSTELIPFSLSEREAHHIFRLPFGRIPGYSSKNLKLALAEDDISENHDGILVGEVDVRRLGRKRFYWKSENRSRHMYVLGKTGTGKSYFLSNLISHDIRSGNGVMVIDPHGDLIETVLSRLPRERIGDVRLFDPGDTNFPPGLNLLEFDVSDPFKRSFVLEEAVSIFLALYGGEVFGPRIQQYFRGAVLSLMDYAAATRSFPTLIDVARIFLDTQFQQRVRNKVTDTVAGLFWKEFDGSALREKQEMIPYFQSKFGPLITNRVIRNVVGQKRSFIQFDEAIEASSIILVNLSKGKIGDINANLLGLIIIAKLNWAIMARARLPFEERKLFSLYVDEFQNVASKTFSTMLSEARKYGLSTVLANQHLSQLRLYSDFSNMDPNNLIHSLMGNVGTLVSFQTGREDAALMASEMRLPGRGLGMEADSTLILNLPNYQAILSTSDSGKRLPACYLYSLLWEGEESVGYGKQVEQFVKLRSCPPEIEVSKEIDSDLAT